MEQNAVHMVMGAQEAAVMGTALGVLLANVEKDIAEWKDEDETSRDELLVTLSVKFAVEDMFSKIMSLLGFEEDEGE
jgi:hypothetical protein